MRCTSCAVSLFVTSPQLPITQLWLCIAYISHSVTFLTSQPDEYLWLTLHAGGPLVTTFRDMGHWMTVLSRSPQLLGLNQSIVRDLFTVGGPNRGLLFGQGIITYPFGDSVNLPLGTPWAYYVGNCKWGCSGRRSD